MTDEVPNKTNFTYNWEAVIILRWRKYDGDAPLVPKLRPGVFWYRHFYQTDVLPPWSGKKDGNLHSWLVLRFTSFNILLHPPELPCWNLGNKLLRLAQFLCRGIPISVFEEQTTDQKRLVIDLGVAHLEFHLQIIERPGYLQRDVLLSSSQVRVREEQAA